MQNNWYVLTGGPSTGKTTVLEELEKLGYKIVHEGARVLIDLEMKAGKTIEQIREDEFAFQKRVHDFKVKTEAKLDPKEIVFLDRGLHDSVAYMKANLFDPPKHVLEDVKNRAYKGVFMFSPLGEYEQDYSRTEDQNTRQRIQDQLHEAFSFYGMTPQLVPKMSVENRVEMVLNQVNNG